MTTPIGSPARIGLVKPDFGVTGGFEALLAGLVDHLEATGHQVVSVSIPGRQTPRPIWGQHDAASRWFDHPDYFGYLGMVHDTRRLELDEFDMVISTQPPSYLAPHDNILGLFYHQARTFYELREPYIEAGFMDRELHEAACDNVHRIDAAHLGGVRHWLAGSHTCAERLRTSWVGSSAGTMPITVLDAPPLTTVPDEVPAWSADGPVVCVSRHEWPKRTELAVAAGHLLAGATRIIGGGGRLEHVTRFAQALAAGQADAHDPGMEWLGAIPAQARSVRGAALELANAARSRVTKARGTASASASATPGVTIEGRVDDTARNEAYATASVFLAPALSEDYGLTALEAMAWGRPVVVCADGGGLVEIVEATGGGLVVDPDPQSIADGVRSIQNDVGLAAELCERAAAVRHTHTWERAHQQLLEAVNSTLAGRQ